MKVVWHLCSCQAFFLTFPLWYVISRMFLWTLSCRMLKITTRVHNFQKPRLVAQEVTFLFYVSTFAPYHTNAATLTPLYNTSQVIHGNFLWKLYKYYPSFLLLSIRACPNPGYKFIGRRHFCVVVVLGLNCNRENGSTGKVRRNARIYLTSGTGLKHRLFSDLGSFKFNANRSICRSIDF